MSEHILKSGKSPSSATIPPRKCGIATFTCDLRTAVAEGFPKIESFVAPVNDLDAGYDYPEEVRFEFAENDLDSYGRTAAYLNFSNADVVCLQHEYGIFGGRRAASSCRSCATCASRSSPPSTPSWKSPTPTSAA